MFPALNALERSSANISLVLDPNLDPKPGDLGHLVVCPQKTQPNLVSECHSVQPDHPHEPCFLSTQAIHLKVHMQDVGAHVHMQLQIIVGDI